jgi:hypothetical protein
MDQKPRNFKLRLFLLTCSKAIVFRGSTFYVLEEYSGYIFEADDEVCGKKGRFGYVGNSEKIRSSKQIC